MSSTVRVPGGIGDGWAYYLRIYSPMSWGYIATYYDGPWFQLDLGWIRIGCGPLARLSWWLYAHLPGFLAS